eukprot:13741352-Alexandrium_andersonii.AAC.1
MGRPAAQPVSWHRPVRIGTTVAPLQPQMLQNVPSELQTWNCLVLCTDEEGGGTKGKRKGRAEGEGARS